MAEKFDLYDHCLHTEVTRDRWDEDAGRWIVTTDRGDAMRARFVSWPTASSTSPKLAGIPGMETFKGQTFHTSRWDYVHRRRRDRTYRLAGKRVGIIGTGATAVQAIPQLAGAAKQLYVFQRTPSTVDVREPARPTASGWRLEPGWQRRAIANFRSVTAGARPTRIWWTTRGPSIVE